MPGADRYNAVPLKFWIPQANQRRKQVPRLTGWARCHPSDSLRLPIVRAGIAPTGRHLVPLSLFLVLGRALADIGESDNLIHSHPDLADELRQLGERAHQHMKRDYRPGARS